MWRLNLSVTEPPPSISSGPTSPVGQDGVCDAHTHTHTHTHIYLSTQEIRQNQTNHCTIEASAANAIASFPGLPLQI